MAIRCEALPWPRMAPSPAATGPAKSGCGTPPGGSDEALFAHAGQAGDVVGSLSFSPDGKLLLSGAGSAPANCHVYDIASGKEIVTYTGHDNIVLATAFSPDGRWAATGGGATRRSTSGTRIRASPGLDPMASRCGSPARGSRSGRRGSRPMGGASAGESWQEDNQWRRPLEQALTLPLGEGALGAPVALGEAEAGAFRRAQASFGGFSLSHRKGGAYGYDAILDISKDGRAVASIARDATNGYAAPIL